MNNEIDGVSEFKTDREKHEFLEEILMSKLKGIAETRGGLSDDFFYPELSEVERTFLIVTEAERGFAMEGSVYEGVQDLAPHAYRWSEIGMESTARVIKICALISELADEAGDLSIPGLEDLVVFDRLNEIRKRVEELSNSDFVCEGLLVKYALKNKDMFGC